MCIWMPIRCKNNSDNIILVYLTNLTNFVKYNNDDIYIYIYIIIIYQICI